MENPGVDDIDENTTDEDSELIEVKDEKKSNQMQTVWRANFTSGKDALKWLKEYERTSHTCWIVKEEFKSMQRAVFHKYWKCQLSSLNKKDGTKRNKGCAAGLDILIKKVNRDTIKNDPNFLGAKPPLAGVITFKNSHNHDIDNYFQPLGFLRISDETREEFMSYFNDGLKAGQAMRLHESKLLLKDNAGFLTADASTNPARRTVYYLHTLWKKTHYGPEYSSDPLCKLREKIEGYASRDIGVHIDDNDKLDWAVLVVTPLMQRAQKLIASAEVIFIDSTSSVESTESTTTLVVTATKGGAVPIAILMHARQTIEAYTRAFALLRKEYPKCFGGKEAPEAFMTDHSDAEKAALKDVWKEAIQLLCYFHVGQAEWRWLRKAENKVPDNRRRSLMTILQKMMYAISTEEFEEALDDLKRCEHEKYINHVEKELLNIKEEWVKMFRSGVLNRGHDTNNFCEACIRILKDIILERTKAFNVTAMVDFIANVWEPYFQAKLLHYANGREAGPDQLYQKLCKKMPDEAAKDIQRAENGMLLVPSGSTPGLCHEVEASIGWCSCPSGRQGAFCKHQALVHRAYGGLFPNAPAIDGKSRHELAYLALGDKCPPLRFYQSPSERNSENTDMPESNLPDTVQQETPLPTSEVQVPYCGESSSATKACSGSDIPPEKIKKAKEELLQELGRFLDLGEENASKGTFLNSMSRFTNRLKRVKNSSQALVGLISISSKLGQSTRREGYIKVQSTATARRLPGKPRGCKRIPAGRPPGGRPKSQIKRKHNLAQSIRENRSHPRAGGH